MGKVLIEMAAVEPAAPAGQVQSHTWPAIPNQRLPATGEAPANGKLPAPAMPLAAARASFTCR